MGCVIKYKGQSVPEEQFLQYLNKQIAINQLFESDSNLAKQVYEALGFGKKVDSRLSVSQEGSDGFGYVLGLFDNNQERIGKIVFRSKTYLKDKGYPTVNELHLGFEENYQGKGYFQDALIELLNYDDSPIFISSGRVINDNVFKAINKLDTSKLNITKVDDGFIITLNNQITPQQKQQALQQYSQYLDQIFPDSKVKDIVYHYTDANKFDKFIKDYIGSSVQRTGIDAADSELGIFFGNKNLEGVANKEKLGKTEIPAIINIKKGNTDIYEKADSYLYSSDRFIDEQEPSYDIDIEEDEDGNIKTVYKEKETVKGGDFDRQYYNRLKKNLIEQGVDGIITDNIKVVFEPEQVHILGSTQDIEGFKNFVDTKATPQEVVPERTPSVEEQIMDIETKAGLRHNKFNDKSRKRYIKYEKASSEVRKFNQGPYSGEYIAYMIKVLGEKGDQRVYYAVKVDRRDLYTLNPPNRRFLVDNYAQAVENYNTLSTKYFGGSNQASLKTVLDSIAEEGKYVDLVNHIKSLLSEEEMNMDDMVMLEEAIATNIVGSYDPVIDRIVVYANLNPNREDSLVILHEIIHRITNKAFANARNLTFNNALHQKGEEVLNIIKTELALKYQNEYANDTHEDFYGLTNPDEFLSEGMTNPKLIAELKSLSYKKSSIIDIIADWIAGMLGIEKKNSAYKLFKEYYDEVTSSLVRTDLVNPAEDTMDPEYAEMADESAEEVPVSEEEVYFERFKEFVLKLNPNFKLEVLEDLIASRGVNAIADIRNFTIKVQKGKGRMISEEVAHFYVELLPDDILLPMLDVIPYTRLYKQVIEDYKNVYGSDFMRLKKEAAAQLIAMYMDNPTAAEYWSGSPSVWEAIKRFIMNALQWIKGKRSTFQGFVNAAEDILGANVSKLSIEKSQFAHEMYSVNTNTIETLKNIKFNKYDKILLNLNDTIFDYQNYSGKTSPPLALFQDPVLREKYYKTVALTNLAKELKDKKDSLDLKSKIIFYTEMPVDEQLHARMRDIFGEDMDIRIISTNASTIGTPVDDPVHPFMSELIGEIQDENPNSKILYIDNKYAEEGIPLIPGVETFIYNNSTKYHTAEEKFNIKSAREKRNAIRERFQKAYDQRVDDTVLSKILRIFTKKIKSDVKSFEFMDTVVKKRFGKVDLDTFLDENGEVALPEEGARAIARALKKNQYLEAMIAFVESLEQIGKFFNDFNKDNFGSIRSKIIDYNQTGNREQLDLALFEINKLSNMIKKWTNYIDGVLNIINTHAGDMSVIAEALNKTRASIEIARANLQEMAAVSASSALLPVFDGYNANKQATIKELEGMYQKTPSESLKKRIEEEKAGFITADKLADVLMGNNVEDVPSLMIWLQTSADYEDPLVASVAITIRAAEQQVNYNNVKKVQEFTTQVEEAKKGLSQSEMDKLTVVEKHYVTIDGEKKLVESKALLNPYQNLHEYEERYDKFLAAVQKFNEFSEIFNKFMNEVGTPSSEYLRQYEDAKTEFRKAKDEWDTWSRQNFHQEYTDEYFEAYEKLIKTPEDKELLEETRELQGLYYDKIEALRAQLETSTGTEAAMILMEIKELRSELKGLKSDYDSDGNLKTGKDLKIAEMLREKAKIDSEVYTTIINLGKFKTEFNALLLTVGDVKIKEQYKKAIEAKDFQKAYEIAVTNNHQNIAEWLDNNTNVKINDAFYEEKAQVFKQIQDIKNAIAKVFDDNGVTLAADEDLSVLWDQIFSITSRYRDENGVIEGSMIPLETQNLIRRLEEEIQELMSENKYPISELPADSKDEVIDMLDALSGLTKKLDDLQSKRFTQYYQDDFTSRMIESGFDQLFFQQTGFQITPGTPVNILLTTYQEQLETVLINNPRHPFAVWFNSNHILKEKVVFDEATTSYVPVYFYSPTYIWKHIVPKNKKHISRLPNEKFSRRKIKDKYKTEKNSATWDETLRMWKPKTARYYNPLYTKLSQSKDPKDVRLFNLLQIRTKYHLGNQEEAGSVGKLGYRLPYVAPDPYVERSRFFKTMWERFKNGVNFFEQGEDNYNETDTTEKKGFRSFFNNFFDIKPVSIPGYDYFQIAVPFTKYIPIDQTSNEIDYNLVRYGNGVSRAGAMLKLNPLFKVVERSLEQSMENASKNLNLDVGVHSVNRSRRGNAKRLEALRFVLAKEVYGYNKAFELGKGIDKTINVLKSINTFGALGSTPAGVINIIKNNIQGRLQNIINSQFYYWSDHKSMAKASMYPKNNYWAFLNETAKPVDKRGIDYHIITFFNPMMTNEIVELIARQGGAAKKTLINDNLYLVNKAAEFGLTVNSLYAHLIYTKVTNGKETVSLKDIMYFEDNQLKVREEYQNVRTGETIDMDYMMRTQLAYRSVLQYIQGKVSEKTMTGITTLGAAAQYFKGWLIPNLRRRFGAKIPNFMVGQDLEGYWRTTFKVLLKLMTEGRDHWNSLTQVEKYNVYTTLKEIGIMMITSFIIAVLFDFDVDDEDKYATLQKKGWLYNTALRIALQAKGETEALSPMIGSIPGIGKLTIEGDFIPPVVSEGKNLIQNPFIFVNFLTNYIKFGNAMVSLLAGSDKAYYDRNIPIYNIEKGDAKAEHYLKKILGINALTYSLDNPEGRVMSYISVLRR